MIFERKSSSENTELHSVFSRNKLKLFLNNFLEHSYLKTNYFLQAINNAIYDDEILTTNRIQDYISKETSLPTEFEQTPVIEGRAKGYYGRTIVKVYTSENKYLSAEIIKAGYGW